MTNQQAREQVERGEPKTWGSNIHIQPPGQRRGFPGEGEGGTYCLSM